MTYILGYFSVVGFSVLIALIVGVLTATLAACYFDLKSRQAGLNKLPEGAAWVHIPKKRLEGCRSSVRDSSKEEDTQLPLLTPKEASTRSQRTPAQSRMDQDQKHKRMIEAVYIASGRAVPAHFISASTKTARERSVHQKPNTSTVTVIPPPPSDSLLVDKTQSVSSDSVRTMATVASEVASVEVENTQRSPPETSDRKVPVPVPEPTPEQIERATLAFIREIEKTAPTAPSDPPSDAK